MHVRILTSISHHEYRLLIPVGKELSDVTGHMQTVVEQLGSWEERSLDELDLGRLEHQATMADITAYGASLWLISVDYSGRLEVVPTV